jgi:hypothetical protein
MKMADDEWIKIAADGRAVRFIYQELMDDAAFISVRIEGDETIYSAILTNAGNPLSRERVEDQFQAELSKRKTESGSARAGLSAYGS